jgi:coatomer subunit beta'
MRFEIKKSLCSQSERVKNVEFHTELPWVLAAMYSGNITIYDYSN